jgi:hypothetical protein
MTDLDRRVAELRGWTYYEHARAWVDVQGNYVAGDLYSPETNLIDAYKLWDEARPEGWGLTIYQAVLGGWSVVRTKMLCPAIVDVTDFADLPRAITQAWLEAKEGR